MKKIVTGNIKSKARAKTKSFDDYNYEETYQNNIAGLSEASIESLFHSTRYKVSYTTKTIKSGNQFEVEIYPAFKLGEFNLPNNTVTKKESSKEQKQLNSKNSRKRLDRLVHCNFGPGDLWVHLTFNNDNLPTNLKEAKKKCSSFFRRLNYRRKKKKLPNAKYVYVLEEGTYGTERFHVHMVMDNLLNREEVEEVWNQGYAEIKKIRHQGEESLRGICLYMTKDPERYKKTAFRLKGKREWSSSKGNLKQPLESKNKTAFSKKKVMEMAKDHNSIEGILEAKYKKYQFKEVEVRYNDFNGLFYIYARMQDKKTTRMRI